MSGAKRLRKAIAFGERRGAEVGGRTHEYICAAIVEEFLPRSMSHLEAIEASVVLVRAILDVAEGK